MTSPDGVEQMHIAATTGFFQSHVNGEWYWRTWAANGECIGVGGHGDTSLRNTVTKFFAAQGSDYVHDPGRNQTERHYSKLYRVNDTEYHIRRYTYGPEPYKL